VESSTFSSELVAAQVATEMIKGLRIKLQMMGVEVIGPTSMFCDNASVVMQSTRPESALKKKHQILAYHLVCEAQAANIMSVSKESGKTNLADIATKLCTGPVLRELSSHLLW
jgi:RPA family protein